MLCLQNDVMSTKLV